ncbi:ubiquitin-conjugating enzyme [Atractiella rhizophila]|nr:ubiquitin-conjugating enzyme [Atractiella rhizophila]
MDAFPAPQPSAQNLKSSLAQELMSLMMSNVQGVSAFPESDNNMFKWVGKISGASGTVYEGMTFRVSLHFPASYPYKPPTVRFTTRCYHPNVDLASGHICLDILKEEWSAVLSVTSILTSLQSLLGEPNNDSPLNVDAAKLWNKPEEFKKELARYYQPLTD